MKGKFVFFLFLFFSGIVAQGVTTATISGKMLDNNGSPLVAADIYAVHEPSGTQYWGFTLEDGRYTLANVKVGGPYSVVATTPGFLDQTIQEIYLGLGQNVRVNFVMVTDDETGDEVVITADRENTFNTNQTGAATIIGVKEMGKIPTISRSAEDLTKLTPQSSGNSFGGRNDLYNNFSIDGSIFNQPFGLDHATTPGGQTNAQPISIDALEQVQVSIAPFDVTQGGFTGAGVNAVTKSGTNVFTGSVYNYSRNESFISDQVSGNTIPNPELNYNQFGFTVGGPIIENELFFFVNGEFERRDDPGSNFLAHRGTNGENISNVLASDLDAVKQYLISNHNYDPGVYENYLHKTGNDKFLMKLNWNLDKEHDLVFRYNYLRSSRDVGPHPAISVTGRGPNAETLPFSNNSYEINNNMHSVVGELNSRFGANFANKFQFTFTALRDFRDPWSANFPSVDILKGGKNYISFGQERFSTNNVLDSDILQVSDNFNYYTQSHVFTAGFNYEAFKFKNSFNLFYFPGVTHNSMEEFLNGDGSVNGGPVGPVDYNALVSSTNGNAFVNDVTDVAQFAMYMQDEYHVSEEITVTYGLRFDMPLYSLDIPKNAVIEGLNFKDTDGNDYKVDVSNLPDQTPLWSPRVGMNWNMDETKRLRGGTGIFTGRIPFVWIGNQVGQSKINPFYQFYLHHLPSGFKFPQVWKSNLAYDTKLPAGITMTTEFLYGKDINAVVHKNYNMPKPTSKAVGADSRAIFNSFENRINTIIPNNVNSDVNTFLDAGMIVLENTDEGYQMSFTTQLSKSFGNGMSASLAYNFAEAKDITSNPGEIAADAFQKLPVVGDPNQAKLTHSDWGTRHRIVSTFSYEFDWSDEHNTSVSFFLESASGSRYSYVYAGDMNRDGIPGNDLIYVPTKSEDIVFGTGDGSTATALGSSAQSAMWSAFDSYIKQDDYLTDRRGDYAERNGAMEEWFSNLDLRLTHDFSFKMGDETNTLQLSLDILNVGNMINSDWGVRREVHTKQPLSFEGYTDDGKPVFNFDHSIKNTFRDHTGLLSKWQAQFGIRYSFN